LQAFLNEHIWRSGTHQEEVSFQSRGSAARSWLKRLASERSQSPSKKGERQADLASAPSKKKQYVYTREKKQELRAKGYQTLHEIDSRQESNHRRKSLP
jgi:hypothetical protein